MIGVPPPSLSPSGRGRRTWLDGVTAVSGPGKEVGGEKEENEKTYTKSRKEERYEGKKR